MARDLTIDQPQEGYVIEYAPRLTAFEFKSSTEQSDKVVIFVGGLGDGLLTVPYLPALAQGLDKIGWSLIQILISSSYIGWGTGSLARDADEISKLVKYLRSNKGHRRRQKIVLMGHSTGCQDTMQYLTKLSKTEETEIDAGILQAPVSDRMALSKEIPKTELLQLNAEARALIDQGRATELLPKKFSDVCFGAPLNAYRWLSLVEVGGDDDFFSYDLSQDELLTTFGKVDKPLLVLYSGSDEFHDDTVSRQELIEGWELVCNKEFWSQLSRVIEGASHNVGPDSTQGAKEELVATVCGFVSTLL